MEERKAAGVAEVATVEAAVGMVAAVGLKVAVVER